MSPTGPRAEVVQVGTDRRREGDQVDGVVELAPNEGVVVLLEK